MYPYPPLIAALAVGVIVLTDMLAPGLSLHFLGQRLAGAVIAVAGLLLALWATLRFRSARTTIHPDRLEDRAADMTALITDGPFAFSRNPIYLGMALLVTGAGLGIGSLVAPLALAGFVWFIQTRQIVPEERMMAQRFGPEFDRYAAHVNRWFGRRRQRIDATPA